MAVDNAVPGPSNQLTTLTQWEALYAAMGSGVVAGVGNEFIPTLDSANRLINIGTGTAILRGFCSSGSTATATNAPTASASPRIDRLVLRLDRTAVTAVNWVKPVVVAGTPGASPSPPAIQSSLASSGQWDLPICQYRAEVNGSLTSLVDERYKLSAPFAVMTSASRPSPAPPRMGWETDTARLVYSDGTSWYVLVSDTGWVDLTPASGFVQGPYSLATRIRNGVCHLTGSFVSQTNVTTDRLITSLPAAAKPSKTIRFPVYCSTGLIVDFIAYAGGTRGGQLWAADNAAAINFGQILTMTTSWPL